MTINDFSGNDFSGNNLTYNNLEISQEEISQEEIYLKSERLNRLKNKIELMEKSNHIEALHIIYQDKSIKLSENNNGTFINLTDIDETMLDKIEDFIQYIELQKHQIDDIEKKKASIENIYFQQNANKDLAS